MINPITGMALKPIAIEILKNLQSSGANTVTDDIKAQIEELAAESITGSVGAADAKYALNELIAGFPDQKEKDYVKDLFAGYITDNAQSEGTDLNTEHLEIVKGVLFGNLASSAIATGAGLFQVLDGQSKMRNLTPPKMPAALMKNEGLQNALNEATRLAEDGDPEMRSFFKNELAELEQRGNARAMSAGNAGSYLGNAQANQMRSTDALSDYEAKEAGQRNQFRQMRNQLLQADINETQRLYEADMRRYGEDRRIYEGNMAQMQNQINSGVENAFGGLSGLMDTMPIYKDVQQRTGGGGLNINLPKLSTYKMLRLGSDFVRQHEPDAVQDFRSYLKDTGIVDDTMPFEMQSTSMTSYESTIYEDLMKFDTRNLA